MPEPTINGVPVVAFEQAIRRIVRRHDGVCAPAALVAAARNDESIRPAFEWDDTKAAADWRIHQARRILNTIRVVVEGQDAPVPAYVHVTRLTSKGVVNGYMETRRALAGPTREGVLRDALSLLQGARRRYGQLDELSEVWAALDALDEALKAAAA